MICVQSWPGMKYYEDAVKCVESRIKAGGEHDTAEKFEDEGDQVKADVYWDKAEKLLREHFEILMKKS